MRIIRDPILRTSRVPGRGRDLLTAVGDTLHGGQGEDLLIGGGKPT